MKLTKQAPKKIEHLILIGTKEDFKKSNFEYSLSTTLKNYIKYLLTNNEKDETVLYSPIVEQGDIMIVPQFLMHYTEPNKVYFKKRIISFDFHLDPILF